MDTNLVGTEGLPAADKVGLYRKVVSIHSKHERRKILTSVWPYENKKT